MEKVNTGNFTKAILYLACGLSSWELQQVFTFVLYFIILKIVKLPFKYVASIHNCEEIKSFVHVHFI